MQVSAYLKILRLPNLAIILFTQGLYRFCIVEPFYGFGASSPALSYFEFGLLMFSTILIAGGGYIINDIFDVQPDKINKPEKAIAGKIIGIKKLKIYYWAISLTGIITGVWLSWHIGQVQLGLIFPIVSIMLWYYSSRYQKTVLTGNLLISLMSGLVVLIVWLFEVFALIHDPVKYVDVMPQLKIVGWITLGYALFAFLLSLIREILKDIEDREGDQRQGYKTLVIRYGLRVAKRFTLVLQMITIVLLAIAQYVLYVHDLTLVFWYLLIAVQMLMVYFIIQTATAQSKDEFHFLSNAAKLIMVAGILSMQLFYISV